MDAMIPVGPFQLGIFCASVLFMCAQLGSAVVVF